MTKFLTLILVVVAALLIYQNAARLFAPQEPQAVEKQSIVIEEPIEMPKHITKTEVYKWVDENGQVHFSDRTITGDDATKEKITVTSETTGFSEVPKIRPIYIPSNRQSGSTDSRRERCKRLKKQVTKEEARAKRRTYSSGQRKEISDSRWQVIKNC